MYCCQIAVSQLPSDSVNVFRVKNRNDDDDNCVITNYYQHGPCNVDQYVMMEMLMVTARYSLHSVIFDWKRVYFQVVCICVKLRIDVRSMSLVLSQCWPGIRKGVQHV